MRDPDFITENGYLRRWWVIPRNHVFNIYLHNFLHSDDDRALHDHPWWSVSFLLKGNITEYYYKDDPVMGRYIAHRKIKRFLPYIRSPKLAHRLELNSDEAWTIFLTGWWKKPWGFYKEKFVWVPWKQFLHPKS